FLVLLGGIVYIQNAPYFLTVAVIRRTWTATRISHPEITVPSSRCISPLSGLCDWAKISEKAAQGSNTAGRRASVFHRISFRKAQVSVTIPIMTHRKLRRAIRIWIVPVADSVSQSTGPLTRSVGKKADKIAPKP